MKVTDKMRLDWLQKYAGVFTVSWVAINFRESIGGPILRSYRGTVRQAIDAEIRLESLKKGVGK